MTGGMGQWFNSVMGQNILSYLRHPTNIEYALIFSAQLMSFIETFLIIFRSFYTPF